MKTIEELLFSYVATYPNAAIARARLCADHPEFTALLEDTDDSDGAWRTVGGRAIFIKNGQSIESAMKEKGLDYGNGGGGSDSESSAPKKDESSDKAAIEKKLNDEAAARVRSPEYQKKLARKRELAKKWHEKHEA